MRAARWLLASALWGTPVTAGAHATRTLSLDLREVRPGEGVLQVRGRLAEDDVSAAVSPPCRADRLPDDDGGAVLAYEVRCDGALDGAEVRVEGLGPLVPDAVLLYALADGRSGSGVLTVDSPSFRLPPDRSAVRIGADYVGLGFAHVLGGADHLLFLLLLVLQLRRIRAVLAAEVAFTVSHTLSFGAASTGLLHVDPLAAEAAIALSLVLLALDVHPGTARPGARGARLALGFGLVHGLGFAGGLAELGLPDTAVGFALAGFATGVEAGQVAFLAAVLALFLALSRTPLARHLVRLEALAIPGLGGLSMSWLLARAWICLTQPH